jgi:hypothetical protein
MFAFSAVRFDAWLLTPAPLAMIDACGAGGLTDDERHQLSLAEGAIEWREQRGDRGIRVL